MPVNNRVDKPVDIKEVVQFAGLDDRKYMVDLSGRGDYMNYLPASKFSIEVDSSKVLANGTVKEYYKNRIISPMIWEYAGTGCIQGRPCHNGSSGNK